MDRTRLSFWDWRYDGNTWQYRGADIGHLMERLVPEDGEYAHGRLLDSYGAMAGNPTGHLKAHLTGNHCVFPVIDGKLKSGSAQDIYLCEYDGPQYRTIYITIIGE